MTKKVYAVMTQLHDATVICLGIYTTFEKACERDRICSKEYRYTIIEELYLDEDMDWRIS